MAMIVCAGCGQHHHVDARTCPHCNAERGSSSAPSPATLLLGLFLGAAGGCDAWYQPMYGAVGTVDKFPTSTGDTGGDTGAGGSETTPSDTGT
jgi:hypothetical protein